MLGKWRKAFDEGMVKDNDYIFVRDDICKNNRKTVVVLCLMCAVIFAVLIVLGVLNLGVDAEDLPIFSFFLLYSLGMLIFVKSPKKENHKVTMIATYLTMATVMLYGLVVSYRSPDQYTVTFIVMLGIMSMTFVDKPGRIVLFNGICTALCITMVALCKTDAVKIADIINIASFSVLSSVGGFFTMNVKVHSYVMDKLHEEDIEKGRQRLDEKEIEALQLLTAVQATYDMVVCVNLTKNTYKLIGVESFVTHGDAVEGNFDEVIDIHVTKVVEEHKQKYYDTFSRKALLKAYEEGKKSVYLEYQQCDEAGVPHWLGTHTMFIENPRSEDVTEITISQNIDERVRKEEDIKAALQGERDKAEQAQKAKTDFLFQMSHDIRTPMNAIIGFANFIKTSDDLYAIHNDYVLKLETAGEQLLMLINDALEMSRIESGKLVFQRGIHDIRAIIMNVVTVMQIQADAKGIELVTDICVENPIVNCDQNHLNRVIMNLVSNAVKFTLTGGRVTISLHEKPCENEECYAYELKVKDTGIGMSPEFLKKVFDPFEREQTSTVSGQQGTGLGLAIVKRIVSAASDTISVESKQGVGTVFTVNLELLRGERNEERDRSVTETDVPSFEDMAQYFKGKRILLAEDNEFNLTIAKILLENAGFCVDCASDGRAALNKVINAPVSDYYDAILMDIQMPLMNGYEATGEIRKLKDSRAHTKIIAVTANAFDTDKDNALAAGMDGHIAKPIDVEVLYETLWRALLGKLL